MKKHLLFYCFDSKKPAAKAHRFRNLFWVCSIC